MRIADELARGIEAGFAPQLPGADDESVTVAASWWFSLTCRTCGHTFRRGDKVRVDAQTRLVEHLEPGLGCAGGPAAGQTPETASFATGLLSAWPSEAKVIELKADDWRLPRPGSGRTGQHCLYCAHTFRPGEQVVVCPCRRGEPACGAAVHRDPARGLPCLDRWRPTGTLSVCPVAMVPVTGG
jgi:hypothetical protein